MKTSTVIGKMANGAGKAARLSGGHKLTLEPINPKSSTGKRFNGWCRLCSVWKKEVQPAVQSSSGAAILGHRTSFNCELCSQFVGAKVWLCRKPRDTDAHASCFDIWHSNAELLQVRSGILSKFRRSVGSVPSSSASSSPVTSGFPIS